MNDTLRADLIVVGNGVVGLAIAYEAARRGLEVVVVGRESAGIATRVSGGMLAPAAEVADVEPVLLDFARASCAIYPEFVRALEAIAGTSCNYRSEGSLLVALHRDHFAELEHLAESQTRMGVTTQWLSPGEVRKREPYIGPRQVGALHAADDHQVEPLALHRALATALDKLGGTLIQECRVAGLDWRNERVQGLLVEQVGSASRLIAPAVVLAAGAWSNDAIPEAPRLPLRPVRGQVVRVTGPELVRHVLRTPNVYLVPRASGEILLGATSEEAGFDDTPLAGAVLDLLREGWALVPGLAEHRFVETAVGFRPALRDNLPAIGASSGEGLFIATGHYRHGVMLAPLTARLLVDTIQSRQIPEMLRPFSPTRFE